MEKVALRDILPSGVRIDEAGEQTSFMFEEDFPRAEYKDDTSFNEYRALVAGYLAEKFPGLLDPESKEVTEYAEYILSLLLVIFRTIAVQHENGLEGKLDIIDYLNEPTVHHSIPATARRTEISAFFVNSIARRMQAVDGSYIYDGVMIPLLMALSPHQQLELYRLDDEELHVQIDQLLAQSDSHPL